ncbi:hypothetical protein P8C59_009350 [Phyllachora maydis]|uniref:MADS-box domain-containing protein n=1 Tax=Phyllachora maydis TaxID=1825666 RepID=A0AAD9ICF6_9PEZI|nr:hypothetical protein P8C59_009350 [Phyllachora maydis]
MADITDQHDQTSPTELDESHAVGNGNAAESRKRPRPSAPDDDDDDDEKGGRERRKIEIKFIHDKSRRHITFSKRKAGIMKKAYELSVLTGTQVLLLVVSETGLVYTFTTPKLQPLVTKAEGKNLIQACLNAPEPAGGNENGSRVPPSHLPPGGYMSGVGIDPQAQAMAYSNYVQQGNRYMPGAGMAQHNSHQA